MRLKQFVGGVSIAGALGAAALGMGAGFAGAAPGAPPPPGGHGALPRAAPAMAGRSPEISTIRPAPMTLADRAVPADRVGPVGRLAVLVAPVIPVALVDQADLAVPAARVGRITPAARAGPAVPITPAAPVGRAGPITPAVRVVPGMGTPTWLLPRRPVGRRTRPLGTG